MRDVFHQIAEQVSGSSGSFGSIKLARSRKRLLGIGTAIAPVGLGAGLHAGAALASSPYTGFNVAAHHLYECAKGTRTRCTTLQQAAQAGATIVRLDFAKLPFVNQEPPYPDNEEAYAFLDTLLSQAAGAGLRVVVDPHAMPGAARHTTLSASDRFWTDPRARDALFRMWRRLAQQTKRSPTIIHGFDLINEPYNVAPGVSLNALYRDLVREIRNIDPDRNVILDFYNQHYHDSDRVPDLIKPQSPTYYDPRDLGARGNANGAGRIYYSTHFYWPGDYTHQGISFQTGDGSIKSLPAGQRWPDPERKSNGTPWTRAGLEKRLVGVRRFADRVGHWRIFIGEFSASACLDCGWETRDSLTGQRPTNGADTWLYHAANYFERQGWSWTYHSLNGAYFWDAATPRWRWHHLQYLMRQ